MNEIFDNKRKKILGVAALCAGSLFAMKVHAADPMTSATGGSLASGDRKFVEKATIGGMTEIKASELAKDKATDSAVKEYASHMIDDHTKAATELSKIATVKGVTTPGTLDKSHQSDVDKLAKLSGKDFDKAYMKQMMSDHKTTVSDFEKESKSGKDTDLQAFASKTLRTLQGHLDMAKSTTELLK